MSEKLTQGIGLLNRCYWSPTLSIWLDERGDDLQAFFQGRRNPPWWPSANGVEMLIDSMACTGGHEYDAAIESLYLIQKDRALKLNRVAAELQRRGQWGEREEQRLQQRLAKVQEPGSFYTDFQNEYLDDSGWWALTWLKFHARTGDPRYLATAVRIHAHMAKNWRPDKDGGVLWCEDADKQRPNSITNNLFLILSARLHQVTGQEGYLKWALQTLEWMQAKSLYDGVAMVDGPGHRGDYWSYNQATLIGGFLAVYETTGRPEYLDQAVLVTRSVLHEAGFCRPDGVLQEKMGTKGDASLFKGILARYLGQLRAVLESRKVAPDLVRDIDRSLRASVQSILSHAVGADGLYVAAWQEGAPERNASFNTQLSALMAMVAVLEDPALR